MAISYCSHCTSLEFVHSLKIMKSLQSFFQSSFSSLQKFGIWVNRKSVKSRVVRVVDGNLKGDSHGQPSDSWAWRKYGQKPIKGSRYPRSYYRCSSCKGCPAKKKVERSQTEPSILIVTYTSDHNHPWQPRAVINSNNKKHVSQEASCELDQNNTLIISPGYPLLPSMAIINQVVEEEEVIEELSSMKWESSIEEEDHFFADLGELPEYSTIFSRA